MSAARTVGVEEELLIVGGPGGRPRTEPLGEDLAEDPDVDVEHELKLEQAEIATEPHDSITSVEEDLRDRRRRLVEAAAQRGARVVAVGTSPVPTRATPTPDERYDRMVERFGSIGREQLTCGAHVHVGVESRAEGVAVIDRMRTWLPVLVALSANSPFWAGVDTGYASYRSMAWGRWPTSGAPPLFGGEGGYDETVDALIASGAALDTGMVYFDARLSANFPTVEIRVADVGLEVGDTVLVAAISRALVEQAAADAAAGREPPDVPSIVIRALSWSAARYGLAPDATHWDPRRRRAVPVRRLLDDLLEHIDGALGRFGDDLAYVHDGVERLLARGCGADVQRAAFARGSRGGDVLDLAADLTRGS